MKKSQVFLSGDLSFLVCVYFLPEALGDIDGAVGILFSRSVVGDARPPMLLLP